MCVLFFSLLSKVFHSSPLVRGGSFGRKCKKQRVPKNGSDEMKKNCIFGCKFWLRWCFFSFVGEFLLGIYRIFLLRCAKFACHQNKFIVTHVRYGCHQNFPRASDDNSPRGRGFLWASILWKCFACWLSASFAWNLLCVFPMQINCQIVGSNVYYKV